MQVVKRDGNSVLFDRSKIVVAIQKANAEVEPAERATNEQIDEIINGHKHTTEAMEYDVLVGEHSNDGEAYS